MNDDEIVAAWRALAARSRRRGTDAEDHVQDAVVAALDERRRTGRAPTVAAAWLRTVAHRREVDQIRRAQCERRLGAASYGTEAGDDTTAEVLDRHEARWLAAHVERLPAATREVVHALADGGSQADVALRLGLTPRAVEAHVRRARQSLRRVVERAGAVAALVRRRWRRGVPVVGAGVAAAVGLAMLGVDGPHELIPLPHPRIVSLPHPPDGVTRGYVAGAPGAVARRAAPAPAARPAATAAPRPAHRPGGGGDGAPPAPDPVGTQLVLVTAGGAKSPTTFPTERGAWYDVTVGGTYSYNSRATGLADCGHYVAEGATQWSPLNALLVDGEVSPCTSMPLDPTHTYRWRVRGTGHLMVFQVQDYGGGTDNLGALAITMTKSGS